MTNVAVQEEVILCYAVHRPVERPDAFLLYELYEDEAEGETHMRIPDIRSAI